MVTEKDVFAIQNSLKAKGNSYYISASGNDNNNGTRIESAWKTITRVNNQRLNPGDRILFKGGNIFTGNLELHVNGRAGELITVCSYGKGKAILKAENGNGIKVYNSGYISIKDFIIQGNWNSDLQSGNEGFGVIFYNDIPGEVKLGSLEISNCEISGFMKGGISIMSNPGDKSQSGYQQIRIDSNVVHDNGEYGIATVGPVAYSENKSYAFLDLYVRYNKIYNNLGVTEITYTHTGNGLVIGDANTGIIEYNLAYNNGWKNNSDKGGPCGIWCYDATNLVFQYNESHSNGTAKGKADGDGFDLDGGTTNCIMQYNYSHNNFAAGFLIWEYGNTRVKNHGNILRFNVSENDNTGNKFYAGITLGADAGHSIGDNLIYHNTIYSNKGSCVNIYSGSTGSEFYNNIFFGAESNVPIVRSFSVLGFFLCNDYYNPNGFLVSMDGKYYKNLEDFRSTGNEKYEEKVYGFNVDPGFESSGDESVVSLRPLSWLSRFRLKKDSPMLNAGFMPIPVFPEEGNVHLKAKSIDEGKFTDIGAYQSRQLK